MFMLIFWCRIFVLISIFLNNTSTVLATIKQSETEQQYQQQQQQKPQQQRLAFCRNTKPQHANANAGILYVSTLDGKITALEILNGGNKKWSVSTTPGHMISSSIHNLELTNNGQWVRMIPSLTGALYKFDGETVEPIPINADNLLSSSFKFSDDLVISGGKETISYGISAHNGRVIYECSMHGCTNSTDLNSNLSTEYEDSVPFTDNSKCTINKINDNKTDTIIDDEVIIVRRHTQTVRAIEPRTGGERWNFSVGQHELELVNSVNDCQSASYESTVNDVLFNLDLKVIVPEGIICAVHKNDPHVILWKYKFDHPIVNIWKRNEQNQLKPFDLFQMAHLMWQPEQSSTMNDADKTAENKNIVPSIYIGMYDKQLYIQESDQLRLLQVNFLDHLVETETNSFARIPWKPIEASSSALARLKKNDGDETKSLATTENSETEMIAAEHHMETATSILYASEYANGNGFYLYATIKNLATAEDNENEIGGMCNKENETMGSDGMRIIDDANNDFNEMPTVNIVSLWYWWKEIMVISLTTAFALNLMLPHRKVSEPEVVIVERHVEIKVPATLEPSDKRLAISTNHQLIPTDLHKTELHIHTGYISRFQTDFDMLQCLGKGGFGVVFEVKNKLDDCNYAIKRIILPKRKESRERVMREVKTLANCEHQNIVRYFQAWVEFPPTGWQENEDRLWMESDALSHSIGIDSHLSGETPLEFSNSGLKSSIYRKSRERVHSTKFQMPELNSIISNLYTNECVKLDGIIRKTNFNLYKYDDDDSLSIEFRAEEKENDTNDRDVDSDIDDEYSSSVFSLYHNECTENYSGIEFHERICKENCLEDRRKKTNINKSSTVSNEQHQRSFSVGSDFCIAINDEQNDLSKNKNNFINSRNVRKVCCDKNGINNTTQTHRRPLSLDLTSTGSVHVPNNTNTSTPPIPRMYLYIQMQLCRKQSLKDWLQESDNSTRSNASLSIFKQIVEAVEYVHLKGLIHRDLKPSNIFFALDGQIKIGDFGLVTDMSENPKLITCIDETGLPSCAKHTEQVGTQLYMSPEQLRGRHYSYKVDIYSLGLIFFELLVVFGTEMERVATLKSLRSCKFPSDFPTKYEHEYNLLKLMLSKRPHERPTTYGIRGRPPFSEMTDEGYHFELPPRRRDSQTFSNSFNNSSSSANLKLTN